MYNKRFFYLNPVYFFLTLKKISTAQQPLNKYTENGKPTPQTLSQKVKNIS